jgi:allantoinase
MHIFNDTFALHSERTVTPEGIEDAWVVVREGKILAVLDVEPEGIQIQELHNLVLMPGLIDSHVHINEPGRTEWEGFETATKAAARGGITTLVDMPLNSSPVTTTLAAFEQKLSAANGRMLVNCGFYGGLIPGNTADLEPLLKAGVLGIKAFLSHSGIDEFPNATEADLRAGMPIIAKYGVPLLVHCELVSDHPAMHIMDTHPNAHDAWLRSRPKSWENEAVALMIRLCRETGCKTHIVHLSSAEAVPLLQAAIAEGLPITVETCPHYLVFSAEEISDGQTIFKCAPPIREKANNEMLWDALRSGLISMIVTDHSPATPSLKGLEDGRFREAWGGIASLQFSLPAVWTAAQERGFGLLDITKWMSSNVAKFLGLDGHKGKIATGFDADFVVWAPDEKCATEREAIAHRHPVSPYVDRALFGNIYQTYVGGQIAYEHHEFGNLSTGKVILNRH